MVLWRVELVIVVKELLYLDNIYKNVSVFYRDVVDLICFQRDGFIGNGSLGFGIGWGQVKFMILESQFGLELWQEIIKFIVYFSWLFLKIFDIIN